MSEQLPAEVAAWIGKVVVEDAAEVLVERGLIENFCSSVEDGNPLYWDETVASEISQGIVSPPGMLSAYNRPHPWTPSRGDKPLNRPLELHFKVKDALGYPRGIVTELAFEFLEPVRPGDRLRAEQSLREVSEIRSNRLGTGRNWTIDVTYRNQHGLVAGIESLSFFGYRREQA